MKQRMPEEFLGPNHVGDCHDYRYSGKGYNRVKVCVCGAEDHSPEENSRSQMKTKKSCRKCGGEMGIGTAIKNGFVALPDFTGDKAISINANGRAPKAAYGRTFSIDSGNYVRIKVLKCHDCGWSVEL